MSVVKVVDSPSRSSTYSKASRQVIIFVIEAGGIRSSAPCAQTSFPESRLRIYIFLLRSSSTKGGGGNTEAFSEEGRASAGMASSSLSSLLFLLLLLDLLDLLDFEELLLSEEEELLEESPFFPQEARGMVLNSSTKAIQQAPICRYSLEESFILKNLHDREMIDRKLIAESTDL